MRQQAAIHIDETSWRVDGVPHWLWVFVNDVVALYVVSRSRGSKVPQALLGPDFDGVAISDFFSAYSPLGSSKPSAGHICCATAMITPRSRKQRANACASTARCTACFWRWAWRFATEHYRTWQCRQLAERIKKYLDDLLVWLSNPAVDPTNNTAEGALRGAVITRKTSFGSRSKRGAQAFARLLSIIMTWERQGKDFFPTAHQALVDACSQS